MFYINKLTGQCRKFAEACIDTNSIDELVRELTELICPDMTDCQTWEISTDEWAEAVKAALDDKLHDAIENCLPNEDEE